MKKYIIELSDLIKKHGYWSDEVYNYNNMLLQKFGYNKYQKIHLKANI